MSELHKPLPALPSSHALTTLSVNSRNHRAQLIKHFLTDIQEPGVQARRDGWLYVFEEVLDELSVEIVRGDWLACVKRGKELKQCLRVPSSIDKSSPTTAPTISKKADSKKTIQQDDSPPENIDESANKQNSHPLPPTPPDAISPFEMLIGLVAPPLLRDADQRAGHLLLCLTPHGSRKPMPTEDSGFDILPANIGCSFSPGTFNLKKSEDEIDNTILYGLEGLEGLGNLRDTNLRLIGGTFTFKGVNSPMQHMLLAKVFRLAIYVHLALILEQHFLSGSGVEVKMSRPKLPASSPSIPASVQSESRVQEVKLARPRIRNSIMPSSFTNFFLKRSLSQRAQTTTPTTRGGSLDLEIVAPPHSVDSAPELAPRKSHDGHSPAGGLKFHRFSFMGDRHLSLRRTTHSSPTPGPASTTQPFVLALKRIEESKDLLSTSPKTATNLPKLLVELAEKEKANTSNTQERNQVARRRLKGDERVALTSLLGWDGKDAEGRGMSGILGFVRQQEISVLCSLHVTPTSNGKKATTVTTSPELYSAATSMSVSTSSSDVAEQEGSSAFTNSTVSSAISASTTASVTTATIPLNLPATGLSPCGKPYWITYRYYSSETGDSTLGEWIEDFIKNSKLPCERSACKYTKGQHEIRLIHDSVRIVFRAAEVDSKQKDKEDVKEEPGLEIKMWESCAVCAAKTTKVSMDDGTYLLSYAKFLELLIYAPSLCILTPSLCEHTTPSDLSGDLTSMPPTRFNIIRHFSTSSGQISLALSPIEDVFELRVPRLQITRGTDKSSPTPTRSGSEAEPPEVVGEKKKILRKEIKRWWEGVSDHIDKLEKVLNAEEMAQKALPRLPSMDEAYDTFDTVEAGSGANTPTPANHPPLPPLPQAALNTSSEGQDEQQVSHFTTQSNISTDTQASKTPTVPPKEDAGKLLVTLRHNFQKIEQSLYTQLAKTPEESLNDVRRSFLATGKGTQKRLKAWQAKHIGASKAKVVGVLVAEEPEWWGKGCHAVPGGNIIVRENDWGSIIAHTLSTADYQLELANLSIGRSTVGAQTASSTSRAITDSGTSSFFSVAAGYRLFTSSSKNQPDPDQEDVVWNEPEQYSAVISRKDHARDPTSLLSIRDVLRQNSGVPEQSGSSTPTSRSAGLSNSAGATAAVVPGGGVKTKADVALSMEAVGGELDPSDRSDTPGLHLLQEIESNTPNASSKPASVKLEGTSAASEEVAGTDAAKDASTADAESDHASQVTVGKDDVPPPLPPKDVKLLSKDKPLPSMSKLITPSTPAPTPADQNGPLPPPPPTSSGFAHALAHGINSAMRFVLKNDTPPPASPPPSTSNTTKHHALLGDITTLDDRPHIKYDWTIGKRLKFSCTVYYAKQFDILRRRCGINSDAFLQSLSRSTNWAAEGGKSKSNFWKTSDQRYVIKTLVNAWNVADLQVLVDLAPSYFRYMDATASRATVLAKLIGFYTIEIRNLETGAVQSKADLLIMENLFFGQKISKTFDLKGIQGRKVKAHGDTTKTLFDGEWIEGQQRTLTLVRPHSKLVLHEAIKHDAEFLSKSNIMDYSLLLGIDEEKKEIVCGLVDTIGSYTFAKTLEYKAKHGLQSGKEVTVVPPAEYQERFVNALEGYFVACPDKWSKPFDESKIVSDPNLLSSVL